MNNTDLTLLIDLDGTVYDKHNGLWEEMSASIADVFRGSTVEDLCRRARENGPEAVPDR